jgi:hypothetical protein
LDFVEIGTSDSDILMERSISSIGYLKIDNRRTLSIHSKTKTKTKIIPAFLEFSKYQEDRPIYNVIYLLYSF